MTLEQALFRVCPAALAYTEILECDTEDPERSKQAAVAIKEAAEFLRTLVK